MPQTPPLPPSPPGDEAAGPPAPVLLVDDDPNLLSSLSRRLGGLFRIVTAESGADAVAAAEQAARRERPFAAVVCDMHMPGLNGLETLARIRALSPDSVPIMLTGDADQQTAMAAINQGHIFRFYIKPFDSLLLADGLTAALHQNRLLRAERRLAENEERWRLALDAVGDGVWDWDPLSGRLACSDSWHRMLGQVPPEENLSAAYWWDRVHAQDLGMVMRRIGRLLRGEDERFLCEHRLRCADGAYRWFLGRGVVLYRAADGTALRAIGTHADVTERRRRVTALGRMAAGFAHEINTPLGVALSSITDEMRGLIRIGAMLSEQPAREGELRAELHAVGRAEQVALANLNRCADMVARFRRAFSDQAQDPSRVYDMAEIVEEVRVCLQGQFKHLPVTVEVECPPDLRIEGTPAPVEQILTNLMLNALKHGFADGGRAGTIRIRIDLLDGGRVRLLFSDDGVGMKPEDAARLFEPFFTTARGRSGGGLGLFLCYNLVSTDLGGSIVCDSAPGRGTRFHIEFPVTLAADDGSPFPIQRYEKPAD